MGVAAAEREFVLLLVSLLLLLEVVFFLNFKGEYFLDPRRTSRRRNQRGLVQTVQTIL